MKHLRKFKTKADWDAYMQQTPIPVYPYVYYIEDSRETEYSGLEVDIPLYIENITGTSVKFSNNYEYSRDGETWQSGTSSTVISFTESGERVYFRASGLTASSSSGIGSFSSTAGEFNIGGNIMSMVYGADYRGKTELTQTYTFYRMFYQLTRLKSARFLALPATTLTSYCYNAMFYSCTSLVNAPALPATTLASYCYRSMFYGCTSLVNAPAILPATTLTTYCYSDMFYNCKALVNAPALPATTLASYCYRQMFYNCTSLVNAPALPATTVTRACYCYMFRGCTSLVNAPALPATTIADEDPSGQEAGCYYGMFYGCTSLVNAPAILPATTLVGSCYGYMFRGCTSLVNAPALPAMSLSASNYGSNYDGCYNSMFYGCTSLVNAPALPATTLVHSCYRYMFYGCTSLKTAPVLPAKSLQNNCYAYMFYGCTNLSYIKAMFTNTPSTTYTESWVKDVASTGQFVKNSAATWNVTGVNGIPEGWTVETADA